MIFVTIGTYLQGFERLIKEMDRIASTFDEEIIAQIGNSKYIPKNMEYFTFSDENKIKIDEYYEKSKIIISHAGAGTILNLFHYRKPLIVVPRLKKFNEIIDDHQIELAEKLKNQKNIFVVYDIKYLEDTLKKIDQFDYVEINQNKTLINFLKNYLRNMNQ